MLIDGLTRVFGKFNQEMLKHLLPQVKWIEMAGGETLFQQADSDQTLYFVASGRLQASSIDEFGNRSVLGDIARGESVGEMAFFTDKPRSATVTAVRDTMLAAFSQSVFRELLIAYPLVSLNMTRQIIERLEQVNNGREPLAEPAIIAVLPITANVDQLGFTRSLAEQLSVFGSTRLITSSVMDEHLGIDGASHAPRSDYDRSHRVTVELDRIETDNKFVLLVADDTDTEWTKRCKRHCDELLLVADASQPPDIRPEEADLHSVSDPQKVRSVLVLLHPDNRRTPTDTSLWLSKRALTNHIHLRRGLLRDWQRLGRTISRQTVGLALSGGGARGFAHLGVLRALNQSGIDIDQTAGTSIGAVMGAYISMDMPADELVDAARTAFKYKPTGDFNIIPLLSLVSGRRLRHTIDMAIVNILGQHVNIEDLWKSYYCVTSNFSSAREVVHDRGHLAKLIRASVSIPGVLPPVMIGGELHIDGGTFNNFPTDVMRRAGAARVIGVNLLRERGQRYELDEVPGPMELVRDKLRGRKHRKFKLPSLTSILLNTSLMASYARHQQSLALTDLNFTPEVYKFDMLDWSKFDKIVEVGYAHAMEQLEQLGEEGIAAFRFPPA
jgi:NTE family protein